MSNSDPAHDSFMSLIRSRIPSLITRALEPLPSHARSTDLDTSMRSLIEFVAALGFTNGMDCVDVERIKKEAYRDGKREGLKSGMDLGLAKAAQQKRECVSVAVQAFTNPPRCVSASTQTSLLDSPSRFTTSTSTQTSPTLDDIVLPLSRDLPSTISDALELPVPLASRPSSSETVLDAENQKACPAPSPPFVRDFSALRSGDCRPFASLQHRHKRSARPRANRFHTYSTPKACFPNRPRKFIFNISPTTPKTARADRDRRAPPSDTPTPPSASMALSSLAWDRDPRLRDLSRALTALGWVRPG
ncbi:hypothetical protein R3P38DRAFT_1651825 [Favolaschia claudopus]|uniref:Uncharacterized protein n=1 Tax=Favolaschia claudopus TaxID=2862362 RepID=A0AAW0DQI6_9AGAR